MADEKHWRNRGSSDRAAGRGNANQRLIIDTPWTEENAKAYQSGWDHTSGQIDNAEGCSSRADNLIFDRPAGPDAYQRGYDGAEVKKDK